MRQTPMRRGALSGHKIERRGEIAAALEAQGLPAELARRVAFQFVFKFRDDELGDHGVWRAAGQILRQERARLQNSIGLVDRQIVCVMPKLSARQIEDFLDELRAADRRIARTIFNAAVESAHPIAAGRRYLKEYLAVAQQLHAVDPSVARTLANACFTAGAPRRKAMDHFKRFARLLRKFEDNVDFARRLAKAAFRAPDPIKAAETLIRDYQAAITGLTDAGVDPQLARTLAASSRFRANLRRGPALPESC
jgi:hypothetical protein